MTTLPNNAKSIMDVIASFSSQAQHDLETPFWQTIVASEKPGNSSPAQIEQYARMKKLHNTLAVWCASWNLPTEHVEESAFYAAVTARSEWDSSLAEDLGKMILWIYVIDDYLDASGHSNIPQHMLSEINQLFDANALNDAISASTTVDKRIVQLNRALRDLLNSLNMHWQLWNVSGDESGNAMRSEFVLGHVRRCVVTMAQEAQWNSLMAIGKIASLPDIVTYLTNGQFSIGMLAVAAVAASFCTDHLRCWENAVDATEAGGRIVRLGNDIHTYFADIAEHKMTSVSIGLLHFGSLAEGLSENSAEVIQAKVWLCEFLSENIFTFSTYMKHFDNNPLTYYLIRSVAFALAVYGDDTL